IDSIPTGDYIILVANGNASFDTWDPLLKSQLKSALGSKLIDSLTSNNAYIIMGQKGNSTPSFEKFNK
ncbi:MAG TPA: interleukin-like EMT inducer domain-containing protein, partial [Cytophagaceae bacterium]|nr:interleukin-like EMT inducer domain-containing protein [Cytophagaceae bacterium]